MLPAVVLPAAAAAVNLRMPCTLRCVSMAEAGAGSTPVAVGSKLWRVMCDWPAFCEWQHTLLCPEQPRVGRPPFLRPGWTPSHPTLPVPRCAAAR